MKVLVPRLSTTQAVDRFMEIQELLRAGMAPDQLPRAELGDAVPNATGGRAPTVQDVVAWRGGVQSRLQGLIIDNRRSQAEYSMELGRALEDIIQPSRSDAAHDGIWTYLSLMLFPDLVVRRWAPGPDGRLSTDRWIGAQVGRDRNYIKLSWRNWINLGEVMQDAELHLGEDEFLNLFERTSLSRNPRLLRLAAREIVGFDLGIGLARTTFAREFLKRLFFQTGPVVLDLLSDEQLADVVKTQANQAIAAMAAPRRSISS